MKTPRTPSSACKKSRKNSPPWATTCASAPARTILFAGTQTAQLYHNADRITERHRHRYEFNNAYRDRYAAAGFVFAGTSTDGKLVEMIELQDHPFYVASQSHPEFLSKPNAPHPLFRGFIAAAHQQQHHKAL